MINRANYLRSLIQDRRDHVRRLTITEMHHRTAIHDRRDHARRLNNEQNASPMNKRSTILIGRDEEKHLPFDSSESIVELL